MPDGDFKNLSTMIFIMFSDFLMFYQISLSPRVKRCTIIAYKHNIRVASRVAEWLKS